MHCGIPKYLQSVRERNLEQKMFVNVKMGCKIKEIPLQIWTGPEGSSRLRHPDFNIICK